jgi:hypothetical protein
VNPCRCTLSILSARETERTLDSRRITASQINEGVMTPLHRFRFLTLSTFEQHPQASQIPLVGPSLFAGKTEASQLLQIYSDVFAVLTLPVDNVSGRIYNQEVNIWNWQTGKHLCVS